MAPVVAVIAVVNLAAAAVVNVASTVAGGDLGLNVDTFSDV